MPSVTYMNQSGPFWDFIASLEQQGNNHPMFSQNRNGEAEHSEENQSREHTSPLDFGNWGSNFFGGQAFPHRGPPPHRQHEEPREQSNDKSNDEPNEKNKEKDTEKNDEEMRDGNDNGEGPSGNSGSDNEACAGGRGRHGRCGGPRRRGHCGPGGFGGPWAHGGPRHGGPHHGGPYPGPHEARHGGPPHGGPHHGPRGFGRRGGWGPWGRGGMFGGGFDPSVLATQFWNQFNDTETSNKAAESEDHTPDADVFDTENAFVIHVSLPGAKKEDVGVNWDADKSELSVAGVIYRPGDEEFLKALAVNERKVGAFEKKIRLGTRATPAHIDIDGITAKLEDGILRVEVPKLDSGYVEIKKVDIE